MSDAKHTILVIDDSSLSRKKVAVTLEPYFEVIQAHNGKHALELIPECIPKYVFCDLLMPEMDGFEFLKQLSIQFPNIPCTIVTADIQQQTYDRCHDLGATTILKKPAKKDDLLNAIELMKKGV